MCSLAWFWVFAWLFSRPPCGGLWLACVPCAVRVDVVAVRPSVWLSWWLWWAWLGWFVAVARLPVVALACRCRFGAFFGGFLPFSVAGWCVCLSVAFRGNLGHLSALFGGWLVFGLPSRPDTGHRATPSLFCGVLPMGDYPLVTQKFFFDIGGGERAVGGKCKLYIILSRKGLSSYSKGLSS